MIYPTESIRYDLCLAYHVFDTDILLMYIFSSPDDHRVSLTKYHKYKQDDIVSHDSDKVCLYNTSEVCENNTYSKFSLFVDYVQHL